MTDNLLHGPLEDRHRALGASFAEFGGWLMPVSYAGTVAEHNATRGTVGLFDVSHLGKAQVTGPGADAELGTSVALPGDVNGDGLGDVLVGAPKVAGAAGRAYLIWGRRQYAPQFDASSLLGSTNAGAPEASQRQARRLDEAGRIATPGMRHVDHHRHDLEGRLVQAERPLDLGDDVVRRGRERG